MEQQTVTLLLRAKAKAILDTLITDSGLKNIDFQTSALIGLKFVETDVADYVLARGILAYRLLDMGVPPTMENILEVESKILSSEVIIDDEKTET